MAAAVSPNWEMIGNFADWTAAGAAIFAVLVASVAAFYTVQTNRAQQQTLELQRQQLKLQQDAVVQEQARRVTFFVENDALDEARVINTSDLHVDLVCIVVPDETALPKSRVLGGMGVLLPTGHEGRTMHLRQQADLHYSYYDLVMFFADSNGVTWKRSGKGGLVAATDEEKGNLFLLAMNDDADDDLGPITRPF